MIEIEWENEKIRIYPHEKIKEIREKIEKTTKRSLNEKGMNKIAKMLNI